MALTVGHVCIDHFVSLQRLPAPSSRARSQTVLEVAGGYASNVAIFVAVIGEPLVLSIDLVADYGHDDEAWLTINALAKRSVSAALASLLFSKRLSHYILLVENDGRQSISCSTAKHPLNVERKLLSILLNRHGAVLFDLRYVEDAQTPARHLCEQECYVAFDAAGLGANRSSPKELVEFFNLVFLDCGALRALGVADAGEVDKEFAGEGNRSCVTFFEDYSQARLHRLGFELLRALQPSANVVDTTGTYEAFVAVFLASWHWQGGLEVAQRHKVQGAELSMIALGAQGRLALWSDLTAVFEPLRRGE